MRVWPLALLAVFWGCSDRHPTDEISLRYATPLPASAGAERRDGPFGVVPPKIDLDPKKVALGGKLFHDQRVSGDGKVACSSCHALDRGGSNGRRYTNVPDRAPMPVNVPSVFNLAFNFRFAWSGKFDDIGTQIDTAQKARTAMAGDWEGAAKAVGKDESYVKAFAATYRDGVTPGNVRDAITRYCLSLITPGSKFDQFLEKRAALSAQEAAGYRMFLDYGCVSCHQGLNVGGNMYERFGIASDYLSERGDVTPADLGLYTTTGSEEDRFVFRVPSLRNVALTAPYFHDGSAATLEQAVKVMAQYQLGRVLTEEEALAIAAFLRTLTGDLPGVPS